MADDAIDLGNDRPAALAALYARLDAIYDGEPQAHAADRAFADCIGRHAIPKCLPQALLEGFAWDAEGRHYASLPELRAYAVRVAGTVGMMMAVIMGARDQRTLARACELGVAMQLTNIARDVGEDARAGRLYLPLDWLQEAGIDAASFIAQPRFDARLARVVERLLDAADELYERSETGIAQLPVACRPAMRAARLLYAEIGHELRRRGCDSVSARTVVPGRRKVRVLAGRAGLRRPAAAFGAPRELPEAEFLLRLFPSVTGTPAVAAPRGIEHRVAWVVDLFERLERAERSARTEP